MGTKRGVALLPGIVNDATFVDDDRVEALFLPRLVPVLIFHFAHFVADVDALDGE